MVCSINQTYAWRSILQSREVIHKGAMWIVGDGRMIDIWSHKWLPDLGQSRVISPRNGAGVEKVCELFYPSTKYEIRDKYRTVFTPGKLWWSGRFMPVKWVTKMHWFGPYLQVEIILSVKSAYRLLATEVTNGLPPSSDGDYSLTWKRIWKIQAHELLCTTYLRPAWCFDWSWSVLENW